MKLGMVCFLIMANRFRVVVPKSYGSSPSIESVDPEMYTLTVP